MAQDCQITQVQCKHQASSYYIDCMLKGVYHISLLSLGQMIDGQYNQYTCLLKALQIYLCHVRFISLDGRLILHLILSYSHSWDNISYMQRG